MISVYRELIEAAKNGPVDKMRHDTNQLGNAFRLELVKRKFDLRLSQFTLEIVQSPLSILLLEILLVRLSALLFIVFLPMLLSLICPLSEPLHFVHFRRLLVLSLPEPRFEHQCRPLL